MYINFLPERAAPLYDAMLSFILAAELTRARAADDAGAEGARPFR